MTVEITTNHPIAKDSNDHLLPHGTRLDNSRNQRFAMMCREIIGKPQLRFLDLGCAGGGFIKDCIDGGDIGIGIDGSDYSLKAKRGAWATNPDSFLTADISKPFQLRENGKPIAFDVITIWEVLEHLTEDGVKMCLENVVRHMDGSGIFTISVSNSSDAPEGKELHQTMKPAAWWEGLFFQHGLKRSPELEGYFQGQYVRGKKQNAPHSENMVLELNKHPVPEKDMAWRLFDAWHMSKAQRMLRRWVIGYY